MRKVIGFDPGIAACAFAVVQRDRDQFLLVQRGLLKTKPSQPLEVRLAAVLRFAREAAKPHPGAAAAVEETLCGRSAGIRSQLLLAQGRGAAIAGLADGGCREVAHVPPATMKKTLTADGKADKHKVEKMVRRLLHLPAELKLSQHEIDAAGLALAQMIN